MIKFFIITDVPGLALVQWALPFIKQFVWEGNWSGGRLSGLEC